MAFIFLNVASFVNGSETSHTESLKQCQTNK